MTADDIRKALTGRWPDDRYLHVYEAPLDSSRQGRKIDVLVMSLWASDGYAMDAVEVKTTYADWCREWRSVVWHVTGDRWREGVWHRKPPARIADVEGATVVREQRIDTAKSAGWRSKADRFWVAAPAPLAARIVADVARIPDLNGWGVLAVDDDGCHIAQTPIRKVNPVPLTRPQYLGIIRTAADSGFQAIHRAEQRGYESGWKAGKAWAEPIIDSDTLPL